MSSSERYKRTVVDTEKKKKRIEMTCHEIDEAGLETGRFQENMGGIKTWDPCEVEEQIFCADYRRDRGDSS